MRITCISDCHGQLPVIKPTDILLIAGDICPNADVIGQVKWIYNDFKPWLEQVPAKYVIGCAGNHDIIWGKHSELVPPGLKWKYLQGDVVEIEGLKIYGLPWTLPICGAFQRDEEGIKQKCEQIPDDTDIIISHGPPYGILDLATSRVGFGTEHVGSKSLRDRIFQVNPLLMIFGHIHESRGYKFENSTHFVNVSLMNDCFEPENKPMIFDIDKYSKKVIIVEY